MKSADFDKKKLVPIGAVTLFFCLYILLGYFILRDYGISWDETADYRRGEVNYERLAGGSAADFTKDCSPKVSICYYPPFFSMVLYRLAPEGVSRQTFLGRHALTFIFFVLSVFVFFLIGKKIFKDWKIGLLGALFLIISPRIFAHSFYNPKDIPFLSAYVISIYTLLLLLEKKNLFFAFLHGLAAGIAIAIRNPGIVVIPITFLFLLFDLVMTKGKRKEYLKAALIFGFSLVVTAGVIYIFFPLLYTDPIGNFVKSFNILKQYPWNGYQLYMGKDIGNAIPWHYALVWFTISSPIFYVLLFVLGTAILVVRLVKSRTREQLVSLRDILLVSCFGVFPVLAVILMKSVLYTDNRQMYFVYPALLLVSLFGFVKIIGKLRVVSMYWRWWVGLILVAGLGSPVYFMVRYHPYQNVYFNFLAGANMSTIKERFSLDAWGLSDKAGLEYLLKTDKRETINILSLDHPSVNTYILSDAQRRRLNITRDIDSKNRPDYVTTIYGDYPVKNYQKGMVLEDEGQRITIGDVYYSIKVGDTDIYTIYRVDGR